MAASDFRKLVPPFSEVRDLCETLWAFIIDHAKASTAWEQEDTVLPLFLNLADALRAIRPSVDNLVGWPYRVGEACRIADRLFSEITEEWGWEDLGQPEPERSEAWRSKLNLFREKYDRPLYEAALSWQAGSRGMAYLDLPSQHDKIAEEGRALGFRASMSAEEGQARFGSAYDLREATPRFGKYPLLHEGAKANCSKTFSLLKSSLEEMGYGPRLQPRHVQKRWSYGPGMTLPAASLADVASHGAELEHHHAPTSTSSAAPKLTHLPFVKITLPAAPPDVVKTLTGTKHSYVDIAGAEVWPLRRRMFLNPSERRGEFRFVLRSKEGYYLLAGSPLDQIYITKFSPDQKHPVFFEFPFFCNHFASIDRLERRFLALSPDEALEILVDNGHGQELPEDLHPGIGSESLATPEGSVYIIGASGDETSEKRDLLSETSKNILEAALQLGAVDEASRRSRKDIARKAGHPVDSGHVAKIFKMLRRHKYFDSKRGTGGGTWLTEKGKDFIESNR